MARRRIDREAAEEAVIEGRRSGLTLAGASAGAGVHVATVCRWQTDDPGFREALRAAARDARLDRYLARPLPSRTVRWRGDCPECRARVVVRTARGRTPFWRCGRWPHCPWASWRPRHPRDCRHCGGPRFWSHSRRSVSCPRCGMRTRST